MEEGVPHALQAHRRALIFDDLFPELKEVEWY